MHIDGLGILCQPQSDGTLDGGDSVNWTAHAIFVGAVRGWDRDRFCRTFEMRPGAWVRHPEPSRSSFGWAAYEAGAWQGCISRDQMTGVMCLLVRLDHRRALADLLREHLRRGLLFSSNTIKNGQDPRSVNRKVPDFTGPETWSLYVRGLMRPSLFKSAVLCVLDVALLLSALALRFKPKDDVLSFLIRLATADWVDPTPVSGLALRVTDFDRIRLSLKNYWTGWRDQPEMFYKWGEYIENELR